jgi:ATP-dependent Clp endopeptidase proteolytic subunit ClpP
MQLKHVQARTGDTATMLIYAEIGEHGIDGYYFANELQWLVENGVKRIQVRINSPGGSVLHGLSIFSAIHNINANVQGCFIDTYNDGIAASMGGVILMAGRKVYMNDFAKIMLHDPLLRGYTYEELDDKERAKIDAIKDTLVRLFEARTSKTAEEIFQMMSVETWLSSEEAFAGGFIDEIVSTKNKRGASPLPSPENNVKSLYEIFSQYLSDEETPDIIDKSPTHTPVFTPVPIPIPPNFMDKDKKLIALATIAVLLGLSDEADENAVIAELKKNRANGIKGEAMLNETQYLRAENEALKAKFEDTRRAQAVALVEDAIKDSKIRPSAKAQWLNIAMSDYDTAKETFDSMSGHPQLSAQTSSEDVRATWTFREWLQKDPKGLEALKNSNEEVYKSLYKQEYGLTY